MVVSMLLQNTGKSGICKKEGQKRTLKAKHTQLIPDIPKMGHKWVLGMNL